MIVCVCVYSSPRVCVHSPPCWSLCILKCLILHFENVALNWLLRARQKKTILFVVFYFPTHISNKESSIHVMFFPQILITNSKSDDKNAFLAMDV